MKKALIDSDVILDFFFDRDPFSEHAAFVFTQCELKQLRGYITPVIISNVYYLLRKISSHERVIRKLNQLLTLTEVLIIDKQVVLNAMNSKFKDFENALQNYACESNGDIDMIITRNIKDYQNSNLSIMSPENYYNLTISS
jgi:predicted nucleic acid-binding protein